MQEFNLSVRYDLPSDLWVSVASAYSKLDGWIGFGDGKHGEKGIPYWYSFNETEKHISASVEPSGIVFSGRMNDEEWSQWKYKAKIIISHSIGLIVGEIEEGEVGYQNEPLP